MYTYPHVNKHHSDATRQTTANEYICIYVYLCVYIEYMKYIAS